jgi:hypothetical protein
MFGHSDISNILPHTYMSIFFFTETPEKYTRSEEERYIKLRVHLQAVFAEAGLQLYVCEILCHNATDFRLCSTSRGTPQRRKQGLRAQQDL